jgi:hypothetical protein
MSNWSDEETDEPLLADHRNYYKVEKWTKDDTKVERMLYAGSNLDKAREVFASAIYHRPRIRLTLRHYRFGFVTFGAPLWAARWTGIWFKYASHVTDSSLR